MIIFCSGTGSSWRATGAPAQAPKKSKHVREKAVEQVRRAEAPDKGKRDKGILSKPV
jgi:hypothetical protein